MTVIATPVEAGKNEAFDSQGRLEIPDDALFSEDEITPNEAAPAEAAPVADPAKPAEPTKDDEDDLLTPTPEETKDAPGTVRAKPGDKEYDPRVPDEAQPIIKQGEVKPAEPEKPVAPVTPVTQPKLYAGKYSTPEELKSAFIQLGGDPQNYGDDPDKIAEAYSVRQAEFTRSRQAVVEQERQQAVETAKIQRQQKASETVKAELDKVIAKNPKDVTELLTHMQEAMTNIVLQTQSEQQPAQQIDPDQLMNTMKQREARFTELNQIEKDVPRLTADPDFRDAFAVFVQGQKSRGSYVDLKTSMGKFVGTNQTIINDEVKKAQDAAAAKNDVISTSQPNGGGNGSTPTKVSPEDDILGGILSEHDKKVKKFGV